MLSATLVTRDAIPRDDYAVTQVLTAALAASPLGGWLEPDPRRLLQSAQAYIGPLVQQTISAGIVRLVVQNEVIVGAALWSLHPCASSPAADIESVRETSRPWDRLDRFTARQRPQVSHQQLVFLGVHPDRRGQGAGDQLLIGHHALLDATSTVAYAVVFDKGMRDVLVRHGYTRDRREVLLGGARARAMRRLPDPAVIPREEPWFRTVDPVESARTRQPSPRRQEQP